MSVEKKKDNADEIKVLQQDCLDDNTVAACHPLVVAVLDCQEAEMKRAAAGSSATTSNGKPENNSNSSASVQCVAANASSSTLHFARAPEVEMNETTTQEDDGRAPENSFDCPEQQIVFRGISWSKPAAHKFGTSSVAVGVPMSDPSYPGAFPVYPATPFTDTESQDVEDTNPPDRTVRASTVVTPPPLQVDSDASRLTVANPVNDDGLQVAEEIENEIAAFPFITSTKQYIGLFPIIVFAMIVVLATVAGNVCGSGHCSNKSKNVEISSERDRLLPSFQNLIMDTFGVNYFSSDQPYLIAREKALQWIVHEDLFQLKPDAHNMLQRYILAVFYYQTSQKQSWPNCQPPSSSDRIFCYYRFHSRDEFAMRWLSSTDECQWAGISCHSAEKTVSVIALENMNSSVPIPTEIAKLPELHEIRLPLNKFSGTIPRELQELTGLVVLDLGHNGLQGEIPTGILVLPHLEALNLNHNRLFGHFSLPLTLQSKLTGLNLWNNLLTGTLPTEIGYLKNLGFLYLGGNNDLSGTLPTELGLLETLSALSLQETSIFGSIPSEIGMLKKLQILELQNTKLGGTLPIELYDGITDLFTFFLQDSNFSGTISSQIRNWAMMEYFSIANNNFHGELPDIPIWSNLVVFQVNGNPNLTGSLPASLCHGYQSFFYSEICIVADCPVSTNSSNRLVCEDDCCTECCDSASCGCIPFEKI